MAITLNKSAIRCEKIAIASGKINTKSSARPLLYDISRHWRELLDASRFQGNHAGIWSETEEAAAEVIISTMTYLQRIGCKNIEQLLKDTIERHSRQNE
ncbi:hypothetical protein [uncultured Duncaniella sp.]|uniref:hypothetical protein n=1 Tax=uncultured Duncaniella sp. TaxID=2768039 RepID=UPI002729FE00|nr:hypothetical protein [uncultured Duncaniella sp.]